MSYNVASLIGTAIALPLLGVIAVILRFYVRLRLRPTYIGIDDWLITLAVVLVVGQGVNQIISTVIGELGRDDEETVPWRVKNEAKLDWAVLIFEKVTYSAIKLSVLFFYRRIFYQQKTFRTANDILIALTIAWGFAFFWTEVGLCQSNHHGHPCASQEWGSLWFAITEVLGDVAILCLPYPCIRKLQMSLRDKIGLGAIFFLGWLSTVFGIIRLAFVSITFHTYFQPHKMESKTSPNRTPPNFWTTAQVAMMVLAACLPPLGPLIRKTPTPKSMYGTIRSSLSKPHTWGSTSHSTRLRSTEHSLETGSSSLGYNEKRRHGSGSGSESTRVKELESELREARTRERDLRRKLGAQEAGLPDGFLDTLPSHGRQSPAKMTNMEEREVEKKVEREMEREEEENVEKGKVRNPLTAKMDMVEDGEGGNVRKVDMMDLAVGKQLPRLPSRDR